MYSPDVIKSRIISKIPDAQVEISSDDNVHFFNYSIYCILGKNVPGSIVWYMMQLALK